MKNVQPNQPRVQTLIGKQIDCISKIVIDKRLLMSDTGNEVAKCDRNIKPITLVKNCSYRLVSPVDIARSCRCRPDLPDAGNFEIQRSEHGCESLRQNRFPSPVFHGPSFDARWLRP